MRWLRRNNKPPEVRVDLTKTFEADAVRASEADWPRVFEQVAEQRKLRNDNKFGERLRLAFEQAAREEEE